MHSPVCQELPTLPCVALDIAATLEGIWVLFADVVQFYQWGLSSPADSIVLPLKLDSKGSLALVSGVLWIFSADEVCVIHEGKVIGRFTILPIMLMSSKNDVLALVFRKNPTRVNTMRVFEGGLQTEELFSTAGTIRSLTSSPSEDICVACDESSITIHSFGKIIKFRSSVSDCYIVGRCVTWVDESELCLWSNDELQQHRNPHESCHLVNAFSSDPLFFWTMDSEGRAILWGKTPLRPIGALNLRFPPGVRKVVSSTPFIVSNICVKSNSHLHSYSVMQDSLRLQDGSLFIQSIGRRFSELENAVPATVPSSILTLFPSLEYLPDAIDTLVACKAVLSHAFEKLHWESTTLQADVQRLISVQMHHVRFVPQLERVLARLLSFRTKSSSAVSGPDGSDVMERLIHVIDLMCDEMDEDEHPRSSSYVLEHRIAELSGQLEEAAAHSSVLQRRIEELEIELQQQSEVNHFKNLDVDVTINEQRKTIEDLHRKLSASSRALMRKETIVDKMTSEMNEREGEHTNMIQQLEQELLDLAANEERLHSRISVYHTHYMETKSIVKTILLKMRTDSRYVSEVSMLDSILDTSQKIFPAAHTHSF